MSVSQEGRTPDSNHSGQSYGDRLEGERVGSLRIEEEEMGGSGGDETRSAGRTTPPILGPMPNGVCIKPLTVTEVPAVAIAAERAPQELACH